MDDVFNSVPFLTKRKGAIEKEMESIEESMAQLAEQYEALEGEWGDKVGPVPWVCLFCGRLDSLSDHCQSATSHT